MGWGAALKIATVQDGKRLEEAGSLKYVSHGDEMGQILNSRFPGRP
jgi:hypothetical protein